MPKTDWFVPTKTKLAPGPIRMVGSSPLRNNREDFLEYLKSGRVIKWDRLENVRLYMAKIMIIEGRAKIVKVEGQAYLSYRHNWLMSLLTMGWKS